MDEVFIDTSYLVALVSARDAHHRAAADLTAVLAERPAVTTNHVLGEAWTLARRRFGHGLAVGLIDSITRSGRYRVLRAAAEVEQRALDWLRRRDEREYSFVDAVSFQVMRDRGIVDALAFDDDFHANGFRTLRP